jgi:hypothetical protein
MEPRALADHRCVETQASEAERKQSEGPPKKVETAGEAIGEVHVWRRGPIHHRSSTQKSETPTATRAGTARGGHPQQCRWR